jgi:hypothetical protein
LAQFPRWDLDVGELAETGANTVNDPAPRHDFLDDSSGIVNSRVRRRPDLYRDITECHRRDFRKRQWLAGQVHHSHLIRDDWPKQQVWLWKRQPALPAPKAKKKPGR